MTLPLKQVPEIDEGIPVPQPTERKVPTIDMRYLVRALIKYNASDLHLKAGRSPLYRINGRLISAKMPQLSQSQVDFLVQSVITQKQRDDLAKQFYVDFSFGFKDIGRFRCNAFYQRGTLSAAIRMIPLEPPNLDDLGIPDVVKDLCFRPRGLILVTGATGCGKSTTLAGMVQHINTNRYVHCLTLEDPIEYIYRDQKASITQRELGSDMRSFTEGLYSGLRQDPDVMIVGEMREHEVIQTALTAAETGHLVISTMHTNDCKATVERLLEVFPAEMQNQVRVQIASALVGVVSQRLLVRADGSGRVPACEVMVKSPGIEGYIRRNEFARLPDAIANSNGYYKMQSLNQHLERLIKAETITLEEALKASSNPDDLRLRLSGVTQDEGFEIVADSADEIIR